MISKETRTTHPCDDANLSALLQDGEQATNHEMILEHLEQCSRCQQRFDELAAASQDWTKARQALLVKEPAVDFEGASSRWQYPANIERSPVAWSEAMAKSMLSSPSHPEMLGRIGRYDVERLIGSGGMGVVFKAYDTELNRPVAIKLLAPYLAESGSARKRFAREARAAAAVVDEHVVAIHNVESGDDTGKPPFLVMKYIAGGSLQQRLDHDGPLEVCEILRIGMQTAKGLAAAHAQGLIHRDVKPSNILLDEGVDRALLTDFGLARAEDDACLTRSGFHPGTPHYMSPEQVRGEAIDGRSDLFSLGCVLYALCTGHPPFRAETSYAVLRRITDDTARPIRELNPNITEWFERIVMKLLSKSRDDRFDSAQQVAELLEECLAHVQHPTTTPLPKSVEQLSQMLPSPQTASAGGSGRKQLTQLFTIGFAAFAVIFAAVLIVLETNKGTLTIQSEADDVPIRIMQGDKVVEQLTVSQGGKSVRINAGTYIVEIDGKFDGVTVNNGTISLSRRGVATVNVNNKSSAHGIDPLDVAISSLQGDWEFLSVEKEGAVAEFNSKHRLTLSIAGDNWSVSDQVKHRVDIAGQDLVFHGHIDGTPFGDVNANATIALGKYELKGERLTYCMTTAFVESQFDPGNFPVKPPTTFETKGTENVVYRLRRKVAIAKVGEVGASATDPKIPESNPPQKQLDGAPDSGSTLDSAIDNRLKWGEPVNGLRAAMCIRSVTDAAGKQEPDCFMAIQNVSDGPIHLVASAEAPNPRNGLLSARGLLLARTMIEETMPIDVLLQPRQVTFMLWIERAAPDSNRIYGRSFAKILTVNTGETMTGTMTIDKASAGAWTGKLVTGETNGADAMILSVPKTKEAQSLFKKWQASARANWNIPGGTLSPLVRVMTNFIKNNPTHEGAPKFGELLKQIDVSRDWSRDEAVKLLDDVSAIYPSLPEWVEEENLFRLGGDVVAGKPLPDDLKDAPWGEAEANGLRAAWLLVPRAMEHRLNTPLKSRLLFHNTGKNALVFRALTWNQSSGHKARDGQGKEINVNSTYWETMPRVFVCAKALCCGFTETARFTNTTSRTRRS